MKGSCIAYLMYFVPQGYNLPDAVHRQAGFRPRFYDPDVEEENVIVLEGGKDKEKNGDSEDVEMEDAGGDDG